MLTGVEDYATNMQVEKHLTKSELASLIINKVTEVNSILVDVVGDIRPLLKKTFLKDVYGVKDNDHSLDIVAEEFLSRVKFGPGYTEPHSVIITDSPTKYSRYINLATIDAIFIGRIKE